ncbi:hypothetical protein CesoFtcFv8_017414 [Champsocephalus esox]|uniref:Uncharacterized protein n=1 Tax=Champsocephalus esox TaxID=159716 RepID=A0AAN8BJG0_9TELE|nr:hypothetical protein CesoFtcFv8_017414 [Champsocephalus esox]
MILFHPIPLSWKPRFSMVVTSVASAGPQPSRCSSFQPQLIAQYPRVWGKGKRSSTPLGLRTDPQAKATTPKA